MQNKTIWIIIVILVVAIGGYFLFSGGYQAPSPDLAQDEISNKETSEQTEAEVKEFNITAKKWEFDPGTITVNKGDTVKLHIKSIDVSHGFGLSAFGINEQLDPGETVDIEFTADKTGTFTFACSVFCGSGHSGMKGQLIVE